MSTKNFPITLDWTVFSDKHPSAPSEIISLGTSDGLSLPTFDLSTTDTEFTISLQIVNIQAGKNANSPIFYVPNVGFFSYRSGEFFIDSIKSSGTPKGGCTWGNPIGLTFAIDPSIQQNESMDFRLHFKIGDTDGQTYTCLIDPELKVQQGG